MVVTFLVGNGFDISCGLNTSYRSFYDWYLQQPSSSDPIRELKKSICNEYENWADFEIGLARYTKNFTIDTVDDFFEIYEDARKNIINFIRIQTENVDLNAISDKQFMDFKSGLISFYDELPPTENRLISNLLNHDNELVFRFISYNYSSILNNIISRVVKIPSASEMLNLSSRVKIEINPNIVNLHGTINEYPIIGVSEDLYIDNKEILNAPVFRDIMIKPESVNAVRQLWYEEATKQIERSNIMCVFGMSLGESDSLWWEKVMEQVLSSSYNHLIIFSYTDNPPSSTSIYDTLTRQNEIKEKMIGYTALSSQEVSKIKERIHIVFNTKRVLNISVPRKKLPVSNSTLKTPISKIKPLF